MSEAYWQSRERFPKTVENILDIIKSKQDIYNTLSEEKIRGKLLKPVYRAYRAGWRLISWEYDTGNETAIMHMRNVDGEPLTIKIKTDQSKLSRLAEKILMD